MQVSKKDKEIWSNKLTKIYAQGIPKYIVTSDGETTSEQKFLEGHCIKEIMGRYIKHFKEILEVNNAIVWPNSRINGAKTGISDLEVKHRIHYN